MGREVTKMDNRILLNTLLLTELSFIALLFVVPVQSLYERSASNVGTSQVSCPEGMDAFDVERSCLSRPSHEDLRSHSAAQSACRKLGGYLASANGPQVDFVSGLLQAGGRAPNTSEVGFWVNYIMIHSSQNSSLWTVPQEPDQVPNTGVAPTGMFPNSVPRNLSDRTRVCLQLVLRFNPVDQAAAPSQDFRAEDCNVRLPYMCEKLASTPCIDRSGQVVAEGEHYSPRDRDDPCYRCQCLGGGPGVCSSTWCSKPVCDKFIPDPLECCKYSCLDNGGHTPPFNLGDNMRWVLTMITSFLLLGMMLFMVHRMRQKRQAYLRYRVRRFQESPEFEPGSGPPPPSMEDMDGQFFREPPPPYSSYLYLKSTAIHSDSPPPPYQHNSGTQPRRLNLASQRSDEVSLLRVSAGSSLPPTPSSEQTSAPVFITPPESPVDTFPEGTIVTALGLRTHRDSTASTPSEASTVTTPLPSNPPMTSFLGDPRQLSPSRNTAV